MEIIIVVLLVICIMLLLFDFIQNITKKESPIFKMTLESALLEHKNEIEKNLVQMMNHLKEDPTYMMMLQNYLLEHKNEIEKNLMQMMNGLKENIDLKMQNLYKENKELEVKILQTLNENIKTMNQSVEQKITNSLNKTNESYDAVIQRLIKIDEAQKNIEKLSSNVLTIQDILTDKKTRGIFGEMSLKQVLFNVFGESPIYKMQHKLENGTIVDCVIHTNASMQDILIDSKFPLENYRRIMESDNSNKLIHEKQFKLDLKKHIDDIHNKYILNSKNHAVMFIPAEAIFAYINAFCNESIEYALKKNVWVASPTTLIALLSTVLVVVEQENRDKYIKIIVEELSKLSLEFERYQERFLRLKNNIDTLSKSANDVYITSNKITKRFKEINSGKKELIEDTEEEYMIGEKI